MAIHSMAIPVAELEICNTNDAICFFGFIFYITKMYVLCHNCLIISTRSNIKSLAYK